jgi:hypothetical protein
MRVREHIAMLLQFPQDLDLGDEYHEEEIVRYYLSTYDDETGSHDYVAYETDDV